MQASVDTYLAADENRFLYLGSVFLHYFPLCIGYLPAMQYNNLLLFRLYFK